MVTRHLVTTAIESTWKVDVPILFLGEWCRKHDRQDNWSSLDAKVIPYHWDDRTKLYRDYLYLQNTYEELLNELTTELNKYHGKAFSNRYWRILLGPWLGYFIQVLFDRWEMLHRAVTDYEISGVSVVTGNKQRVTVNDMNEFLKSFITDEWNEAICGELLEWMGVNIIQISAQSNTDTALQNTTVAHARRKHGKFRSAIRTSLDIISKAIKTDQDFFFISSYIPHKQELLLQLKLRQLPTFWRSVQAPICASDRLMRSRSEKEVIQPNDFISVARVMINRHIPIVYREGFSALSDVVRTLGWPKRPKAIFTGIAWSSDDVFKAWAAEKVENHSPLIVVQHGGNYGMSRWEFTEDHQIAIADCFLTWGWDTPGKQNVVPYGMIKHLGTTQTFSPRGGALLIETAAPQTSYRMLSLPVAHQWLQYFEDQFRFVQALPNKLQSQLLVRLHSNDFGWYQIQRWKTVFPFIRLDEGQIPINSRISQSRVCISAYNGTALLESMAMNIPTIMFWNPEHWELRDAAIPDFEKLTSVEIFHSTPESAAKHLSAIWDDVNLWWLDESTQRVRQEFCQKYARVPENPLKTLANVISDVAAEQIDDSATKQ